MESASRHCLTCSDMDAVAIRIPHKKYRKKVWASCSLVKGSLWSEAQLKWIGDSCQAMWGHNHEIIRTEQDHALEDDCNSFEMHKVMVRTDQLLCIAETTNSKIYIRELEAETHGQAKTLVLSVKQYHAHDYHFYEKGMTRAMVGLQGLNSSNAFRCSNVSSSVGLKLFCSWCFKLWGNTEMIATHLREVHYWLAITCNLCKSFASMSAQSILDHCSGCKAKHAKEHAGQEGCRKAKMLHKKGPRHKSRKKHPKVSLSSTDESCRAKRCPTPSIQFC